MDQPSPTQPPTSIGISSPTASLNNQNQKNTSKTWPLIITSALSLTIGLGAGIVLDRQIYSSPKTPTPVISQSPTPTSPPSPNPSPTLPTTEIEWRQTDLMGGYTLEYPDGWHVASQWPNSVDKGVYIWIDPEPIDGAPRGGPFSTIEITDISGIPNSDEIFAQKINMYREDYLSVKEEAIDSALGKIYHFTGTMPEGYLGGATIEAYLLRIVRPGDSINDRVIAVSAINQSKYSDVLRHIALSIKKRS